MKQILTAILALLLSTGAFAFTSEEIPPENLFSPEIIEQEKVSDWAKNEIDLARAAGLITTHTQDYMTRNCTRFQFAELAVNLAEKMTGKPIAAAPDTTFIDSKEPAVRKAFAVGIVGGVGHDKFEPDTSTNREQIATMLYRTIAYIEKETGKPFASKPADLSNFTDKTSVAPFAVQSMGILAANGIMNGTSSTTLTPKDPCTVEQSILLVYRVSNLAK